jgi:hypothetical protein
MDIISILLMFIGLLGVLVFAIFLVISFFRKTAKYKWIIGILISTLVFSWGSIFLLRNELLQKQDLESRMGKLILSERDIRGFAYEVILRDVMGEEYEDVMESLKNEFQLTKRDLWEINLKAQEILLNK